MYNISVKKNGLLFPNASKTEVKFKSGKDSATFLIQKYPKIHGPNNKSKSSKIKRNNLNTNGEESFNYQSFKEKQITFYGESLGLLWLKNLRLKFVPLYPIKS